jgi:fused signal recognition particle receptor
MFSKLQESLGRAFKKIVTKTISDKDIEDTLNELYYSLLENNVAMEVAEELIMKLRKEMIGREVRRTKDINSLMYDLLYKSILEILHTNGNIDLLQLVKNYKDRGDVLVILFIGVNGSGKTTTIAKIAKLLIRNGFTVALSCSDTFRAGAQEQLEIHAANLGVKVIKHKYGADPAAVAYDTVKYAKAHKIDVVLIDTAGRMQTDKSLLDELKKITRVVKPDLIIFVGDSLAGNDALNQAKTFNDYIGISGSILTKIDADVKGGAILSITFITKKPILFLGTGQSYDDLVPFNPDDFARSLLSSIERG